MKHMSSGKNMMFMGGTDAYDVVGVSSEVGDLIHSLGDEETDKVL